MRKITLIILLLSVSSVYCQWTQTLNGISIWSLAKDLSGNVYAGSLGSSSALYKTSNIGANWVTLTSGNSQTIFSIAIDSTGKIFAANFSAGLLKSTNGGVNWVTMPAGNFGGSSLNTVACGRAGEVYVGTNGSGFYRSTDNGTTFAPTGLSGMQVITITVDRVNSAFVYAGVTQTNNGFYRSTNYGVDFSSNLNSSKNIYGIQQTIQNDLYTISTTAPGPVDKSTNGGLNWTTVSTGYIARGICDGYVFPNALFIAGNSGVFLSANGGVNFTNQGVTSSATPITRISSFIFVGLSGAIDGGVWIRNYPVGIQNISEVAAEFSLGQNYPNPFNPATNIKFRIHNKSFVKLIVFDVLGSESAILVNQELNQGTYEINWDASNYPSGIYFYRVSAGDYSESKKMILIK